MSKEAPPQMFSDFVVFRCNVCGRTFRTIKGCERHRRVCKEPVDKDQMSLFDYMEGGVDRGSRITG